MSDDNDMCLCYNVSQLMSLSYSARYCPVLKKVRSNFIFNPVLSYD